MTEERLVSGTWCWVEVDTVIRKQDFLYCRRFIHVLGPSIVLLFLRRTIFLSSMCLAYVLCYAWAGSWRQKSSPSRISMKPTQNSRIVLVGIGSLRLPNLILFRCQRKCLLSVRFVESSLCPSRLGMSKFFKRNTDRTLSITLGLAHPNLSLWLFD